MAPDDLESFWCFMTSREFAVTNMDRKAETMKGLFW